MTSEHEAPDFGPYDVDALQLLNTVRARHMLRNVARACVLAFPGWLGLTLGLEALVSESNPLWRKIDDSIPTGLAFTAFMLGLTLLALLYSRLALAGAGAVAAKLVPLIGSALEPQVVRGQGEAAGLVGMLRRKPLINFGAIMFGLLFVGIAVLGAVVLPGAWSAAHGHGEVVTIGEDAEISRVASNGHGPNYYLRTPHGEVIAESLHRRPHEGTRWAISHGHAYLVGGHGYLVGVFLIGVGAAGVFGTAKYVRWSARNERKLRVAAGEVPIATSLAAFAAGRHVVLRLPPNSREFTLGLPPGEPPDPPGAPPKKFTVGIPVAIGVIVLGSVAMRDLGGDDNSAPATAAASAYTPPPSATLAYLAGAAWRPRVVLDIGTALDRALLASELGLNVQQSRALGQMWSGTTQTTDDVPGGPVNGFIDVADLGSIPCDQAVPALIANELRPYLSMTPVELTGIPRGWRAVKEQISRDGPFVKLVGCQSGTLITVHVDAYNTVTDLIGPTSRLATAITHRGIPGFRADISGAPSPSTNAPRPMASAGASAR